MNKPIDEELSFLNNLLFMGKKKGAMVSIPTTLARQFAAHLLQKKEEEATARQDSDLLHTVELYRKWVAMGPNDTIGPPYKG